jgi:type IV pilus assembly protein PilB
MQLDDIPDPWMVLADRLDLSSHGAIGCRELVLRARRANRPPTPDLVASGTVSSEYLAELLSTCSRSPLLDVNSLPPQTLQGSLAHLASRHNALPIVVDGASLLVAVDDPFQKAVVEDFQFATGRAVQLVVVDHRSLTERVSRSVTRPEAERATIEFGSESSSASPDPNPLPASSAEAASTLHLVERILTKAIDERASDVHLEPLADWLRVRLRIDGMLHESMRLTGSQMQRVITRLKVIANLDIAERRVPQDGRLTFRFKDGRTVDLRLSTLPTLYGEKLVLRVLDRSRRALTLDELGFEHDQLSAFRSALARPQGMILVTGPTGSGKTITLYSALHSLNGEERNLSTVEDPVEIHLAGVNQVNIAPHAGMTFATGLRALLRQDPDVIMVGEIRDPETAEIAIKAAQTGHLVLSTLHTNDAPQALTRLVSMGIPRYLIAGSVHFALAQRLLRRLCPHCREPDPALSRPSSNHPFLTSFAPRTGFPTLPEYPLTTAFRAVGCAHCVGGYLGRIAISETLTINDSLQQLILRSPSARDLAEAAAADGYRPLRQMGLARVAQGLTTLEELERVTAA